MTSTDDLVKLESLIVDRAKRGAYELYYGQAISPEAEKELILHGFSVEHKSLTTTYISWGEEEY